MIDRINKTAEGREAYDAHEMYRQSLYKNQRKRIRLVLRRLVDSFPVDELELAWLTAHAAKLRQIADSLDAVVQTTRAAPRSEP